MCGVKARFALVREAPFHSAHQGAHSFVMDTPEWVDLSSPSPVYAPSSCANTNVVTNASSRQPSYRPDGPACPAPIWVLSRIGRSPWAVARSLATHFAGSQYDTRGSLRPAVTSSAG